MATAHNRRPDWGSPSRHPEVDLASSSELEDYRGTNGGEANLKLLLNHLSSDASELIHDEMDLAKLELREIANAFSSDIQSAGQTLVKDLLKAGVALSLATLAGIALTTGFILGLGALLGGAYWASALIVGVVYLGGAAVFGMSAGRDLQQDKSLRLEHGRETLRRDKNVLHEEVQRTKDFSRQAAHTFKDEVTSKRH